MAGAGVVLSVAHDVRSPFVVMGEQATVVRCWARRSSVVVGGRRTEEPGCSWRATHWYQPKLLVRFGARVVQQLTQQ